MPDIVFSEVDNMFIIDIIISCTFILSKFFSSKYDKTSYAATGVLTFGFMLRNEKLLKISRDISVLICDHITGALAFHAIMVPYHGNISGKSLELQDSCERLKKRLTMC